MCSGDDVTLQCTLTGDILTWNKRDGDINLVRGTHSGSTQGLYQWELTEIDENCLQSTLTFTVSVEVTLNCTGLESGDAASIALIIEGM